MYQNTRKFVLSEWNPYFYHGQSAEGVGSLRTDVHMIWPMGMIMRALTSTDPTEINECLERIKTTHAVTGFMHESFYKDNPYQFTRRWFAWANSLLGELLLKRFFPEVFPCL